MHPRQESRSQPINQRAFLLPRKKRGGGTMSGKGLNLKEALFESGEAKITKRDWEFLQLGEGKGGQEEE